MLIYITFRPVAVYTLLQISLGFSQRCTAFRREVPFLVSSSIKKSHFQNLYYISLKKNSCKSMVKFTNINQSDCLDDSALAPRRRLGINNELIENLAF